MSWLLTHARKVNRILIVLNDMLMWLENHYGIGSTVM